jgi:hypothetical protein
MSALEQHYTIKELAKQIYRDLVGGGRTHRADTRTSHVSEIDRKKAAAAASRKKRK